MERQRALKESMKRSALPAPPIPNPPPAISAGSSTRFKAALIPEDEDDNGDANGNNNEQQTRPVSTASVEPGHLSIRTAVSLRAGQTKEQSDRELRELQKGKVFPENVVQCLQILVNALAATELCEHVPLEKDPHVRWYSKAPGLGSIDHGPGGGPSAGEESEPYMFAMTTENLMRQLSSGNANAAGAVGAKTGDERRAAVMSEGRRFKKRRRERSVLAQAFSSRGWKELIDILNPFSQLAASPNAPGLRHARENRLCS